MFSRSDSEVNPLASFLALIVSCLKSSDCQLRFHDAKTVWILPVHEKANWPSPLNYFSSGRDLAIGLLGKLSLAGRSRRYPAEFRNERDERLKQSIGMDYPEAMQPGD
jgi:hypothetical protein